MGKKRGGRVLTNIWWAQVLRPKTSKTLFRPVIIFSFYLELYKNKCRNLIQTSKFKGSFRRCKIPHSFQVLMSMSSHFQESSAWNYFDFQFDDMGYTCKCINMKRSIVCQTIDWLSADVKNIRNWLIPFWSTWVPPLKYFMGVCFICDCIFSTK